MTPEWEHPTKAVLDFFDLHDVTLIGMSLGGYLALRAAAFESRITRVVAYNVLYDFFECVATRRGALFWSLARLALALRANRVIDRASRRMMKRDALARWGLGQGMHVMGVDSPSAFLRETMRYSTAEISSRISQDVLLLAGADDHFVPVHQLERQAAALTNARSVTKRLFTASEHAGSHCQLGNLPLVVETITRWTREKTGAGSYEADVSTAAAALSDSRGS